MFSLISILSSSDNKGLDALIKNNYVLHVLTRTNCDYIVYNIHNCTFVTMLYHAYFVKLILCSHIFVTHCN